MPKIKPEVYSAVIDEAHKHGLRVCRDATRRRPPVGRSQPLTHCDRYDSFSPSVVERQLSG